jgi:hypothetical protein
MQLHQVTRSEMALIAANIMNPFSKKYGSPSSGEGEQATQVRRVRRAVCASKQDSKELEDFTKGGPISAEVQNGAIIIKQIDSQYVQSLLYAAKQPILQLCIR